MIYTINCIKFIEKDEGKKNMKNKSKSKNPYIDISKTFGEAPYWFCAVRPYYEYQNGNKTDTLLGYSYDIAFPSRGLEKVSVKIPGKMQVPEFEEITECNFKDLEITVYVRNNQLTYTATASEITLINEG